MGNKVPIYFAMKLTSDLRSVYDNHGCATYMSLDKTHAEYTRYVQRQHRDSAHRIAVGLGLFDIGELAVPTSDEYDDDDRYAVTGYLRTEGTAKYFVTPKLTLLRGTEALHRFLADNTYMERG